MMLRISKLTAASAMTLVLAALAGCSGAEPDGAPPPPPPSAAYDRGPVDLAGAAPAPPVRYQDGLAGGPGSAGRGPIAVGMAPIPDPEDLPLAERHRIYGDKYDGARRAAYAATRAAPRHAPAYAPPARVAPARPVAAAPAKPAPVQAPAKPAVVAKAPVLAKPVLKPVPPLAPTTAAAPIDPKLAKLQVALAPQVSSAATLTVGAPVSQRLEGPVVLTLPQNLFDLIRQEAAKLGLGRAARASEVSATLSGQGYQITPNGPQTAKLKAGQAAAFQWQVKPGAGELGPLRAQIDASLRGQRKAMTFSMAAVEKAVTITPPAAAKGFKLPKLDLGKLNLGGVKLPNYGDVDVPGIGKTSSRSLIGAGLVLLAVLLLIAIARNAAEAKSRARRRRKFRTMADYGQMDAEPELAHPVATTTTYHDRDGDGVPDTKVETHEAPLHRETEKA